MVQAVVATNFITDSNASAKAFKTATLLKSLLVNVFITGETGVGKKTLASFILPDAPIVDAIHFEELLVAIESSSEIIITNINNSPNLKTLLDTINDHNIRVIATSKHILDDVMIDELFSVKFDIPPLSKRKEDVKALMRRFSEEAASLFGSSEKIFDTTNITPDLSENSHSLRRQVMVNYLLQDINDRELMDIIQNYIEPELGSNNDYKNFLHLYEVPLIKAGLKRFKSQLQLSEYLGLNRNTLRKKIADNKQYL